MSDFFFLRKTVMEEEKIYRCNDVQSTSGIA